ncbi:S28 family serine protease [Pseudobacteriovorax antillogorgiicola]|uniref:PS-10 peptidase S37 n=1 Tax=Pseudobacteriovorax antillogorgiicola TaxID=1513793 RepID=A0A1Y6CQF0_9BACT|nr:S28 family serine protease [Pseudobacteriovorax antillogorgiicola]TCS42723.1 PS-10 peptidase S37 [Pseudobacteriovorax antillogorgiicola]SMF82438.1 PS-10 peptidase S37 [Pseudobacteriovorax antillogorgiicola]
MISKLIFLATVLTAFGCDSNKLSNRAPQRAPASAEQADKQATPQQMDPALLNIEDFLKSKETKIKFSAAGQANGMTAYVMKVKQAIDHEDPDDGTFEQVVTLIYKGADRPTVFVTQGYNNLIFGQVELAKMFDANQIAVEYRYFGESIPQDNFEHLNIWQAATDHHELIKMFKEHFTGKWLTTGASKGGMSAVFHRRYYPNDVDVTVPYVAPISYASPDVRYIEYLDNIGPQSCKDSLANFQSAGLQVRQEVETIMTDFYTETDQPTEDVPFAFEDMIVGFPWGFWQYSSVDNCPNLPDTNSQATDFARALLEPPASGDIPELEFDLVSETSFDFDLNPPYLYQAARELGSPLQIGNIDAIADSLTFITPESLQNIPQDPTHDPSVMEDIQKWVQDEGDRILFIYGENDPWTGSPFDLGSNDKIFRYIAPAGNHGANIMGLGPEDRQQAMAQLSQWLEEPAQSTDLGLTYSNQKQFQVQIQTRSSILRKYFYKKNQLD